MTISPQTHEKRHELIAAPRFTCPILRDGRTPAVPGTCVVDRHGIVRDVSADADYTRRPEPDETVAALEALESMDRNVFDNLAGSWIGSNRLWLDPDAPARTSDATATVTLEAGGKFATIRYAWADDGKPCEGMIVVRLATSATPIHLVWIDSWHMGDEFMTLRAEPHDDVLVSAKGSYPAPPGPDWGWRIALLSEGPDELRIEMDNITPDGEEAGAVEMVFTRAP